MFEQIHIQNFRALQDCSIDSFSRVNVIVGDNNTAKTTLLEALFVALSPFNPAILANIYELRKMPLNSTNIGNIFNNFDEKPIRLKFQYAKQSYDFEISLESEKDVQREYGIFRQNINVNEKIFCYKNLLDSTRKRSFFDYRSGDVFLEHFQTPQPLDIGYFLPADSVHVHLENLSKLIKRSKEKELVELLQIIDPDIEDIVLLPEAPHVKTRSIKEKLDIRLLGKGFERYLNIITNVLAGNMKCIFIDEIENGIYYKRLRPLLQSLFKISEQKQIQIFITTHSKEVLENIDVLLSESQSLRNEFTLLKFIRNQNQEIKAFVRSVDGMQEMLAEGIEVR